MTTEMMMDAIERRFVELVDADGYIGWWESEDAWERYEEQMVAEGFDADVVSEFFSQMAWDL